MEIFKFYEDFKSLTICTGSIFCYIHLNVGSESVYFRKSTGSNKKEHLIVR